MRVIYNRVVTQHMQSILSLNQVPTTLHKASSGLLVGLHIIVLGAWHSNHVILGLSDWVGIDLYTAAVRHKAAACMC